MKSKKIILLCITIIFAVGTACFCLGYHFRIGEETSMKEEQMKDSEKTFHAFIDAINRNDFNSALNVNFQEFSHSISKIAYLRDFCQKQ